MTGRCARRHGILGGAHGFTLIEFMVVATLGSVVAGMAAFSIHQTLPELRANAARRVVESQLISARNAAITQRRAIQVQFLEQNEIRLTRIEIGGNRTEISRVNLEGGSRFMLFEGVPDAPDTFGKQAAVSFGGAAEILFLSDGTLVDELGNPTSGTVFLAIPDRQTTARAVTVVGGTGTVTGYRWSGTQWSR